MTFSIDVRHKVNLQTYDEWQSADDRKYMTQVSTTNGSQEYDVSLSPTITHTCVET